ncbi:uncharacterized protein LOC125369821 [Ricinus communis]|uniref:uncharacterized protein LOC125369821 n=1 Tax=Ricinus communis TaxID=3988 RepID=UPI00201A483A|nr:uncharacterized protein LOC125369821 [Ricinus communis]
MVDAAAGGALNSKMPEQAQNLIEEMAMNNYQWQSSMSRPGRQEVVDQVDSTAALAAQVELLTKKIKQLQMPVHAANVGCEFCSAPHYSANCTVGGSRTTLTTTHTTLGGAIIPTSVGGTIMLKVHLVFRDFIATAM